LQGTNVKVNQDRNPWLKAEIGAAVDPTSGNNYVVMSNDFRENYDHMFYHVSTTNGATWTDETPLAMRPGPPSFSLAKTKIVSPLAMCLPPYIVFCSLNANVSVCGSLTSALIANIIFPGQAVASREGCSSHEINSIAAQGARPNETELSHPAL